MSTSEENGYIRFTTKELLGRIDTKLDALDVKLDTKADHVDLADIRNRVTRLETGHAKMIGGLIVTGVMATSGLALAIFHFVTLGS